MFHEDNVYREALEEVFLVRAGQHRHQEEQEAKLPLQAHCQTSTRGVYIVVRDIYSSRTFFAFISSSLTYILPLYFQFFLFLFSLPLIYVLYTLSSGLHRHLLPSSNTYIDLKNIKTIIERKANFT